jgi:hypothetical protein
MTKLRKKENKNQCHLRNGYFVAVNQFMMRAEKVILGSFALSDPFRFTAFCSPFGICKLSLRGYHTLQGDNFLKSAERFDHIMFEYRFQASR